MTLKAKDKVLLFAGTTARQEWSAVPTAVIALFSPSTGPKWCGKHYF